MNQKQTQVQSFLACMRMDGREGAGGPSTVSRSSCEAGDEFLDGPEVLGLQ